MKDEIMSLKDCKSIAIMGGTFDPVHYGHLVTAEAVCHRFNVDKVLFVPAGMPAHKNNNEVTNNEHRYLMTVLATITNCMFEASRIEIDRPGRTYTIDTINELRNICGQEVKLYFITGADAIHQIFTWKDAEKLITMCDFVAVTRPGYKKNILFKEINDIRKNYESKVHFVEVPALDISSSDIRRRVKNNMPIKYLLPETVENYIMKHNLFKDIDETEVKFIMDINTMKQKLQSALSIKRYIHTMGVMDEAVKLAEIYGTASDIKKARVAGLLHDCAKDYPSDMKRRFCKEYHVTVDSVMDKQIDLVHSFLGGEVAKREYLVEDEDILDAIRYHTTGRAHMTLLDKIVFTADYIEVGRPAIDGIEEARSLAYTDLDMAVKFILESTIEYITSQGRELHPLSNEALEYYKNK